MALSVEVHLAHCKALSLEGFHVGAPAHLLLPVLLRLGEGAQQIGRLRGGILAEGAELFRRWC